MTYRRNISFLWPFLILCLFLELTSCEKFSGDQTIPAYLKIDSVGFTTDYDLQGSASHSIPDAWVYVDGELIGAFPLPADFPVLKEGSHTVKILPGIKKDGIAATRMHYPFYGAVEKTISLVPDQHTSIGAVNSGYSTQAKFLWMEDFEATSISLDTTPRSSVAIGKTQAGSPLTFEKQHSGIAVTDSAGGFFECVSRQDFSIPGAQVFLELDFNINTELVVGVMIYSGAILFQNPVLILNSTGGKWKKIYIDLTTALNSIPSATRFQVYFMFPETSVYHAQVVLDNIKLVTLKNSKDL